MKIERTPIIQSLIIGMAALTIMGCTSAAHETQTQPTGTKSHVGILEQNEQRAEPDTQAPPGNQAENSLDEFLEEDPTSEPSERNTTANRPTPTHDPESPNGAGPKDENSHPGEKSRGGPTVIGINPFMPFDKLSAGSGPEVKPLETVMEKGYKSSGVSPTHIVIRGTAIEGSTRCKWRGTARTEERRQKSIRELLGLGEGDDVPSVEETEKKLLSMIDIMTPSMRPSWAANFSAMARGGITTEYLFLECFIDYRPTEFLLGQGDLSRDITAIYEALLENPSYDLYVRQHDNGRYRGQPRVSESEFQETELMELAQVETWMKNAIEGRDSLIFLAPLAEVSIVTEGWQALAQWRLETDPSSGQTNAIRFGTSPVEKTHIQPLAELRTRITNAAASDGKASERIQNIEDLNAHYRQLGAYGDITPEDGSSETFNPAQPPAPMECASGTATDHGNRDLMHDCENLLDTRETLAGTGSINWDKNTSIRSWDGITVSGEPKRVTGIDLPGEDLTGTIPPEMGRMFHLTSLNLSNNRITGEVPEQLGWLRNLEEIRLSGNNLSGCIPTALENVAVNDLASLQLPYCTAPAPSNLTTGTPGATSVPLAWDPVDGSDKYRVEHRLDPVAIWKTNRGPEPKWQTAAEDIRGTSHTPTGLECGARHQFRVSAYGLSPRRATIWGEPSMPVEARTTTCGAPTFEQEEYKFTAPDDSEAPTIFGTVKASSPDGGVFTYSITGGNEAKRFIILEHDGRIALTHLVENPLDYTGNPSYTLTVEADNGSGTPAVTTVHIDLTLAACHNGTAVPRPAQNPRLVRDCSALLAAKDTLRGTAALNWSKSRGMSNWTGLELDRDPDLYVKRITLTGQDLDGQLPPVLAHVRDIQRLELDDNDLTGQIPAELGKLSNLKQLYLFENRLSGIIPTELGSLENLEVLSLYHNQLSGSIPGALGQLTNLTQLLLDGNELTGQIPAELGSITSLEHLYLRDNHLSGTIPAELADLDLEYLFLDGNSLTGCIPAGLSDVDYNDLADLGLETCS